MCPTSEVWSLGSALLHLVLKLDDLGQIKSLSCYNSFKSIQIGMYYPNLNITQFLYRNGCWKKWNKYNAIKIWSWCNTCKLILNHPPWLRQCPYFCILSILKDCCVTILLKKPAGLHNIQQSQMHTLGWRG